MDCTFTRLESGYWTCGQCGKQSPKPYPQAPRRPCTGPEPYGPAAPGLGDHIANGLAAVGMTRERAEAFTMKWLSVPCGCCGRQERLNRLGRYVKARAAKFGVHLPI